MQGWGPLSVWSSSHAPHLCVGVLQVFQFPPTFQRCAHDVNWCAYIVPVWVSAGVDLSDPAKEGHPVQGCFMPCTLSCRDGLRPPATLNWNRGLGNNNLVSILYFFFLIFRQRGREGEREGEKRQCVVAPYWGPGLPPRHVPWLEIQRVTLWFAGWHSIYWAAPGRVLASVLFKMHI